MRNWLLHSTLIAGLLLGAVGALADRPDGRDSRFGNSGQSQKYSNSNTLSTQAVRKHRAQAESGHGRSESGKPRFNRSYRAERSGTASVDRGASKPGNRTARNTAPVVTAPSRDKWQGTKWRPGTSAEPRPVSRSAATVHINTSSQGFREKSGEHRRRDSWSGERQRHDRNYVGGYRDDSHRAGREGTRAWRISDRGHDRYYRSHVDYRQRFSNHYKPGNRLHHLPHNHTRIWYQNRDYYYFGGSFFLPASYGYHVVHAPIGARVRVLPHGYLSFYLGHTHYYYYNDIYYRHIPDTREYVVVEPPQGAETALMAAANAGVGELFVYPNEDQSAETQERDRYDCHLWAVDQSDYEPGADSQNTELADDYRRALSACLEGRGYTVK